MTLDHHLPKSAYSAVAVNPANLVPACSDCNKTKLASIYSTIHPYFDEIENDRWLYARVLERSPAVAEYFVTCPKHWPEELSLRVKEHFKLFSLSNLYSFLAARALSGISSKLAIAYAAGGAESVRLNLSEDATSWQKVDINCWETVLYEALSESQWFCEGGFRFGEN